MSIVTISRAPCIYRTHVVHIVAHQFHETFDRDRYTRREGDASNRRRKKMERRVGGEGGRERMVFFFSFGQRSLDSAGMAPMTELRN